MKKNKFFSKEFTIGAIGIVALLLVYFLINFFKGIDLFKMGETYYVKFNNVNQLVNSSPVFLNGFKAGNVRNIYCDYANMKDVIVEIEIDKQVRIPIGSTAKISTHMLGGADMSITLADNDNYIAPGDTINGIHDPGIAGEASEKIMPALDNMLPKADSILTSLNTLLANPALVASIENIGSLTNKLNKTTQELNNLLANDIPQITGRMIQIEDDVLAMSSQLKEVDYKRIIATLDSTITDLSSIASAIESGKGTMGLLLKDTTLYNNLNRTTEAATALLNNLRENPKRYVHFSLFGKKEKQ
ncbi:MAG: MCE family protein [Bacteroidaceae bacterium]|nr:MCE family protein [Bacteroidaceae bacterium]